MSTSTSTSTQQQKASPLPRIAHKTATLVLADGTKFIGKSFGAEQSTIGECVFHTSMVGYPESITGTQ